MLNFKGVIGLKPWQPHIRKRWNSEILSGQDKPQLEISLCDCENVLLYQFHVFKDNYFEFVI